MPADVPILQLPKPTYSQSRQSSGDDAGGNGTNATGTGARTPRHVQWAPAVSVDIAPDDNSQRAIHSLDEAGADPEAFRTLSEALEDEKTRSRSTTPPPDSGQSETAPLNPFESASPNAPANLIPHPEVFIDPDERAGLPAPASAPDPHALETEHAADLVRAHTRRRKIMPSLPKLRLPSQSAAVEAERQRIITGARRGQDGTLDVESAPATAGGVIGGVSAGGGILSALLALYDQHDDGASDGGSSSGVSTPSASTRGRRARHVASRSRASTADSSPASPNRRTNAHERAALNQSQSQSQSQSQANHSKRFSMPVVGKVFGLDSRPAKERNGAGVLGPLIATTAGAASAAAPTSSTVVPDVKRPGYHLSRYSLEDDGHRRAYHRRGKQSTASTTASGPETAPVPRTSDGDSYFSLPATRVGSTTPGGTPGYKNRWSGVLKDFPTPGFFSTPGTDASDADSEVEWANEKKRERKKRKRKAEIFITRHISDVLARQQFILKLARAMMMFGGPTHRLQAQIVSTGRVLEVPLSCMYLPDTMLVSFDDQTTYTSNIQLIKQGSVLDLSKLTFAYKTYWAVIHDEISVKEASEELDQLMRTKATYSAWLLIFFGGMASASICSLSFSGSFIDSLVCFLLGSTLVLVQTLSARNELYSSMFETTMCTFISFVAAALAMTQKLCYPAISAGSVVLILPGYLVLTGALELSSRSIVSGSVRLCYAVIYCLFLGFGLAIGLEVFLRMVDRSVDAINATDYSCSASHDSDKWYRATPSEWWAFLTVPMFATFLSLRNHAPYNRRELPLLIAISCIGWVINHYVTKAFPNQNDISAAVGAFAVGLIANLYGRFFHGNAFVVMITGILFQLPSGLSNGGLLTFASQSTSGQSDSYLSGFQTALQLVSICIGMTVGLGMSLVVIFPIQSRKRAGGVFSL